MKAKNIIATRRAVVFNIGWREKKAIRELLHTETTLHIKENAKLTGSRFTVVAKTWKQLEELAWLIHMLKNPATMAK